MFSTASTADGLFMPELQLYKTSSGINGILHLGEKTYTSKGNVAFYVMIFYEEIVYFIVKIHNEENFISAGTSNDGEIILLLKFKPIV